MARDDNAKCRGRHVAEFHMLQQLQDITYRYEGSHLLGAEALRQCECLEVVRNHGTETRYVASGAGEHRAVQVLGR